MRWLRRFVGWLLPDQRCGCTRCENQRRAKAREAEAFDPGPLDR